MHDLTRRRAPLEPAHVVTTVNLSVFRRYPAGVGSDRSCNQRPAGWAFDLRRDRPSQSPRRSATKPAERTQCRQLFELTPAPTRMVEPIVQATFGPRVGHESCRSRSSSRSSASRASRSEANPPRWTRLEPRPPVRKRYAHSRSPPGPRRVISIVCPCCTIAGIHSFQESTPSHTTSSNSEASPGRSRGLSRRCPGGSDGRWDKRRPRTRRRSRPSAEAGRIPSPAPPSAPRTLTPAPPRSGRGG